MNVKILECREFCSTTALSSKLRVVKDYEIDVETGKERTVIIDGIEHKIKRGDVCIRNGGLHRQSLRHHHFAYFYACGIART